MHCSLFAQNTPTTQPEQALRKIFSNVQAPTCDSSSLNTYIKSGHQNHPKLLHVQLPPHILEAQVQVEGPGLQKYSQIQRKYHGNYRKIPWTKVKQATFPPCVMTMTDVGKELSASHISYSFVGKLAKGQDGGAAEPWQH